MEFIWKNTLLSVTEIVLLFGTLIGTGLLIQKIEMQRNELYSEHFKGRAYYLTAFIGVPFHESTHALMCLIFKHKIHQIKFLKRTSLDDNSLGYVSHSYDKYNFYQRIGQLLIGIAPMLIGSAVLGFILYCMNPNEFIEAIHAIGNVNSISDCLSFYGRFVSVFLHGFHMGNPVFWLLLFIAICIASHMSLSTSDLKGASQGVISAFVLLFLLNTAIFHNINNFWIATNYSLFILITLLPFISLVFALVSYGLVWIAATVKEAIFH